MASGAGSSADRWADPRRKSHRGVDSRPMPAGRVVGDGIGHDDPGRTDGVTAAARTGSSRAGAAGLHAVRVQARRVRAGQLRRTVLRCAAGPVDRPGPDE